eukprot:m.381924 g.381924  ORF g.381924 m.381924 type:complete len:95 (+) comp56243_c0_seq6:995-1279(+)
MAKYVREHFPGVDGTMPAKVESCVYTLTPNEDFILDRHPQFSNIILGSPCSGHGFKLAPVCGDILADLALKRTPKHDLAAFRVSNFLLTPPSHL